MVGDRRAAYAPNVRWTLGDSMSRRVGALVAFMALLLVTVTGCARPVPLKLITRPSTTPTSTESAQQTDPLAARDSRFAIQLAQALRDDLISQSFGEPAGGFKPSRSGIVDRFYAIVSLTTTEPARVTFDQAQIILGDEAFRAARQAGVTNLSDPKWTRNRYRRVQKLRVSPDAVVVLQSDEISQDEQTDDGPNTVGGLMPMTWSEFVARFNADPERYGTATGYILTFDGEAVTSVVEAFSP